MTEGFRVLRKVIHTNVTECAERIYGKVAARNNSSSPCWNNGFALKSSKVGTKLKRMQALNSVTALL